MVDNSPCLMETLFLVLFIISLTALFLIEVVGRIVSGILVGRMLYYKHLVRRNPSDWGHRCSDPDDYEQHLMWDEGVAWAEDNRKNCTEVDIVSDGLKLHGEYFDFGSKKAVIIVPGRTESLCYSYYYAPAYQAMGVNVLLIDKRAHGLSEGKYEDNGEHSFVDLLAWARFLHDEKGIEDITLHGICIGCSLCCFTLASPDCPSYIKRFIADGMYETFEITFRNHMKKDQRAVFPYCYSTMLWGKKVAKADFIHNGPTKQIGKVKVPTLLIYTDLDLFSTPDQAKRLYEKCQAEKELYWFHQGRHSHIRFHNKEEYDATVQRWVKEH